jgi:cytochrome b561
MCDKVAHPNPVGANSFRALQESGRAFGALREKMDHAGYSVRQIVLHWIVFVLVAFQFFTGDNMTDLFRAAHGGRPTGISPAWTVIHIVVGVAILVAMLWRLALRRTDGAPPPPKQHPALEWLASAVHVGLYADLIGGALVGLAAYFWLPGLGKLHELMSRQVLLVLFALHVVGAVWHWFVARDEAMTRIFRPAR